MGILIVFAHSPAIVALQCNFQFLCFFDLTAEMLADESLYEPE